ncbi:hypothetical protein D9756_008648 [Leucocoprinus leucothites]|uniref:Rho-GAP domain-containing protein n=1 Tax=Leucocoprinus leucothites TaxID=201217 RepID=A0A8H5D0E4_9AGAR|nr:hypothetical protein D9756_008648 [Leucoagaricus leucothites]
MSSFYNVINSSLRATENATVTVDSLVLPNLPASALSSIDTSDNWRDRRVLTVVSHKDEWALSEEGALYVYKLRPSLDSSTYTPELVTIYPIYDKFAIVMSQMRRNTLDLGTADTKAVLDQPRSGFSLTITPAGGQSKSHGTPTFYATDIQSLSILVAECKRLRDVAGWSTFLCNDEVLTGVFQPTEVVDPDAVSVSQSTSHFNWLHPYISKPTHLSLCQSSSFVPASSFIANMRGLVVSSIPPDLRTMNKPLTERLPPASAGHPGDDASVIQLLRDEWIRSKARSSVRQGTRDLSLRVGTFNVNGKMPSQDLSSWIQGTMASTSLSQITASSPTPFEDMALNKSESKISLGSTAATTLIAESADADSDTSPDILVLGFQELDLSTEALIYSTGTAREDAWCMAIFAALGEKAVQYEKLTSKQLVGMLIVILVKKSLKEYFGDIQATSVGSGILGLMGNKGATAIRLTFTPPLGAGGKPEASSSTTQSHEDDSDGKKAAALTLTFVNAHLAAFDEMVERRNQEFHELSRRLMFGRELNETEPAVYEDELVAQERLLTISLYETDVLFWMMFTITSNLDLNYRVDIPESEFRKLLAEKEWDDRLEVLIRYDQLKKSMSDAKAFDGFQEHRITYLPTYRFGLGLGMDELGYDQKRRPAWTDRILHLPSTLCNVEQRSYDSYPQITMSDHRPVAANFSLNFDLYEKSDYEAAVRRLYHEVHDLDGSHERPAIKVEQSFLDFGQIRRYKTRCTKKVVIENIGKIPCAWRFIPAQSDSPIHPEWLSVKPLTGLFLPGEKTEISITIHIEIRIAEALNLGSRDMSGTLILHTVLGKDHFIAISGEYLPSCYGNKLETLIRLPGPIRNLKSSEDLRPENHPLNAPGEIMRLVNRLMSNAKPPDNLFLQPPDEDMITTIRECLDTGDEFPWPLGEGKVEGKVSHALAHALLQLLDSLTEPILPSILHSRCVQMMSRDEAFELLDALQPAAVNVWITITAFLHFICQSSEVPGYAESIAGIFTAVLMRDDPKSTAPPISSIGKRKFILQFIT